jgi:hypothetical protein
VFSPRYCGAIPRCTFSVNSRAASNIGGFSSGALITSSTSGEKLCSRSTVAGRLTWRWGTSVNAAGSASASADRFSI